MRSNDRCFTKNIDENRLTDWYLFIVRRLMGRLCWYGGLEMGKGWGSWSVSDTQVGKWHGLERSKKIFLLLKTHWSPLYWTGCRNLRNPTQSLNKQVKKDATYCHHILTFLNAPQSNRYTQGTFCYLIFSKVSQCRNACTLPILSKPTRSMLLWSTVSIKHWWLLVWSGQQYIWFHCFSCTNLQPLLVLAF